MCYELYQVHDIDYRITLDEVTLFSAWTMYMLEKRFVTMYYLSYYLSIILPHTVYICASLEDQDYRPEVIL